MQQNFELWKQTAPPDDEDFCDFELAGAFGQIARAGGFIVSGAHQRTSGLLALARYLLRAAAFVPALECVENRVSRPFSGTCVTMVHFHANDENGTGLERHAGDAVAGAPPHDHCEVWPSRVVE